MHFFKRVNAYAVLFFLLSGISFTVYALAPPSGIYVDQRGQYVTLGRWKEIINE